MAIKGINKKIIKFLVSPRQAFSCLFTQRFECVHYSLSSVEKT
jgi:hypothetical protein